MNSKIKILLCVCFFCVSQEFLAQETKSVDEKTGFYMHIKPGVSLPLPFGNNFLSEGYATNIAFSLDIRMFPSGPWYFGVLANGYNAEVTDISKVGAIDNSSIFHLHLQAGRSFSPRNQKLSFNAGLGLGYAYYWHDRMRSIFHDNGFSIMANATTNYRFSRAFGAYVGLQLTKDFLAIKTAPETDKYFNNVNILYFSAGLVFYINQ